MNDALLVELDGAVLRLTINRVDRRNALNDVVLAELLAALREPPSEARVIVLTGAGDRAFCAGADLSPRGDDVTPVEVHESRGLIRDVLLALRECSLPVIARVQGLALAGGLGVMLACDIVVASDTAEFGMPEVNIGLWPFMIGALVQRHVSSKRALDLMMTGRRIDATTALEWGMVSRVVPAAELDSEVAALAAEIAGKSPLVLRLGKAAYYDIEDLELAPALAHLHAQLSLLAQSRDAAEGVAAFFEKRPPSWTGR